MPHLLFFSVISCPVSGRQAMATLAAEAQKPITAQPESSAEMRYVARQPILDLQGRVHGYDLLFRNTPETILRKDGEMAVETMLDNEVIFGLERLTNGLPAFITCTAEALAEGWVLVLVPGLTVLGVSASLEPAPALVEACETLRAAPKMGSEIARQSSPERKN
jgi:EAL and modified HD-GYP domain-containing signal transduction protein